METILHNLGFFEDVILQHRYEIFLLFFVCLFVFPFFSPLLLGRQNHTMAQR